MRSSMIAFVPVVFGALAAAAPETFTISDLWVRNNAAVVESASFTVNPGNFSCAGISSAALTAVVTCSEPEFSFYIEQNTVSNYNLTLYKETGISTGIWHEEPVSVICRAGGTGPADFACTGPIPFDYTLNESG